MSSTSDDDDDDDDSAMLTRFQRVFAEKIPYNKALGLRFLKLHATEVTLILPHDPRHIGHPDRGFLHGGVITALLDAACGAAVFARLGRPLRIATLDLRIDYLRPPELARDVLARAACYHLTQSVAFARAAAYHDDPEQPIATATSTFMVFDDMRSTLGTHEHEGEGE